MRFQRHPHADRRIDSAISIIEALLNLKNLYPAHCRRFLSNCLWQITKAEGQNKYDIRYRSQASLEALRKELRHEHVYRRKDMVDALIARPAQVRSIVSEAVGCVVTKAEHAKLSEIDRMFPTIDGWGRYRRAGIVVVDAATGSIFDLDNNPARKREDRV